MENLSPKKLYEQKKKEKLSIGTKQQQTGRFIKIFIWAVIIIIIVGSIYLLTTRTRKKIFERKIYAIQISDQGRNHINVGASHSVYNSNPPTSGWHYENPAGKGIYKKELPDEQLIHNL